MPQVKREFAKKLVFGLAFDVEINPKTLSGFTPAQVDSSGYELFGALRLEGFAALFSAGFAQRLIIAGGNESRYKGETPVVNRASAIRRMLIRDCKVPLDQVGSVASLSNTNGNILAIAEQIEANNLQPEDCAVVTSHYHIPRAYMDLHAAGLQMPIYPAEAFWLLNGGNKDSFIERLGGGLLAKRMAEEIQGIAHKLSGEYKARTN